MSGKMYRFRAIHGATDPRYLEAWLQTEEAQLAIDNMKTGGSDSGLNITHDRFKRLHVRIAPYAEQVRIVEKLEELLSDLDAGVAELKAAQRKLAQYRQSLLKAAVEGALTADWRAAQSASSRRKPGSSRSKDDRDRKRDPGLRRDDEAQETGAELLQRILRERRVRWEQKQLAKFAEQGNTPPKDWQDKYREPVAPDLTDLPPLPERWTWATIEQLAELVSGHTPKDASKFVRDDGVVQWFKVGDMNAPGNESALVEASARFAQEDASELGLKIAPPGTIVFPKRGGAIATNKKRRLSIAAAYDLNMMGLVAVPSTAEWLWSWFKGIDLAKLSDGSNIPQINNPDIAPLHVPLPPAEEQKQVIGRLDDALISVSLQEAAIANALRQAAAQRKNILKAAFSGQLVPQDPNDEPARELLARIRAAREQAPTARSKGRRAGSNPAPATNAHASSRKPRKAKERA
ncbi:MAG: restriction endonuclease [Lysobacter sp.]|nr:MAG: restriction endonuclease [Lysobacter sp.]